MLAFRYDQITNDLNAPQLVHAEIPTPQVGQIVVKVHAAAINPVDLMVMKGSIPWKMSFPFTMGYDFAGTVHISNGSKFSVGDRVFGVNWGSHQHQDGDEPVAGAFAHFILVQESKLSRLPESLTFE